MSESVKKHGRRTLLALLALAGLLVNCTDNPSGPGAPQAGHLLVAPTYSSNGSFLIDVASVRFIVLRKGGDTAVDRSVDVAPGADSVDTSIGVLLNEPEELFDLFLEIESPTGEIVFRGGPIEVAPSVNPSDAPVAVVPLAYVGTGSNAAEVLISQGVSLAVAGDTIRFQAEAFDSSGAPIPGTPVLWTTVGSSTGSVIDPDQGNVIAGPNRGNLRVVATLLTGPADTASVSVTLPPSAINVVSGGNQTGPVLSALAQPLVARLIASDGVGIAGAPITFTVASGGGSLTTTSATTDSLGRAQTLWTLGPNVGAQTVTASSSLLPGQTATFSATGTNTGVGAVMIVQGDGQSALAGQTVPVAPSVRVTDGQSNPVAGEPVTFSIISGAGTVGGASTVTDTAGIATVGSWTLGALAGQNLLQASVADTMVMPAVFTATGTGEFGAAALGIFSGNNQTGAAGTLLPLPLEVLVTDTVGLPVNNATVVWTITQGGGQVSADTTFTDSAGVASNNWILGNAAGPNQVTASAIGLPPVPFTATGQVGPPASVVIISGDGQTQDAGLQLANPLVVEVRDSVGNIVSGATVSWNALQGSLAQPTTITNAQGRAQNDWTLGSNSINQTASATVGSASPAVFTATANFPNPTILLALSGTNRIAVGSTELLDVTLTAPAPAGGVVVSVSSGNPSIASVQSPGTVTIAQGGTTAQIGVDGLIGGNALITASATGYANGTATITVATQVLSLPDTLNIPFGATASLPVQISQPAPAGGEVVTVVSSDTSAVVVQTPTVTIPAGQLAVNATVFGVFPGSAIITANSATFGAATGVAVTTADLVMTPTTLFINESFGDTLFVQLQTAGSPIAAPAGGLQVTLNSFDATCVAVPATATIQAGLTGVSVPASYGGSATTPCSASVEAIAPSVTPDTSLVQVAVAPGISVANGSVGGGLQDPLSFTLGAGNHGGVNVVVKTLDPSLALISPAVDSLGRDSIVVFVPDGSSFRSFYLHGLEGVADTAPASVDISVSAPGFTTTVQTQTVLQPALDIINLNNNTTTFSPSDPFRVRTGVPNSTNLFLNQVQSIRTGGTPLTVTLTLSDSTIATLNSQVDTAGTQTVIIQPGQSVSPNTPAVGGVEFDPSAAGITSVTATAPGYITPLTGIDTITITAPSLSATNGTIGAGLQDNANISLGAGNHGGIGVKVKSLDPTVAIPALTDTLTGSDSVTVSIANGGTFGTYYVQAVAGVADTGVATVQFEITAPGFLPDTAFHTIRRPGVEVVSLNTNTTTLSPEDPFVARIGVVNSTGTALQILQEQVPAASPLNVTLTLSDSSIAQLVTSVDTAGSVVLTIGPGQLTTPSNVASGGVAFDPSAAGTTTLTASIPGFVQTNQATSLITITAPTISLSSQTVGSGLQRARSATLGASAHGGVGVKFKSLNPAIAIVSDTVDKVGADSVVVPVQDGSSFATYYLQALEGVADTGIAFVDVEVSAPGFVTDTITNTIRRPALEIVGLSATTTTLSPTDPFNVRTGYSTNGFGLNETQAIRPGGVDVVVNVSVNPATVGQLINDSVAAGIATVTIPVGSFFSPTGAGFGGIEFDPLVSGVADVYAQNAAFDSIGSSVQTVTVSAPGMTIGSRTVGAGLQDLTTLSLGATQHGGVNVVVRSSNPSVALVSPNSSTAGSDSIIVQVPNGSSGFNFYVHGIEGQTGSVSVTASANGFTDGASTQTVVQPGIEIQSLSLTHTAGGADDPFRVRIGVPNQSQTGVSDPQGVRVGAGPLTVTLVSSNASLGTLVTTPLTAGTVTVDIPETLTISPTNVASGGVAFRPLVAGTVNISASASGFIPLTGATQFLTVNP